MRICYEYIAVLECFALEEVSLVLEQGSACVVFVAFFRLISSQVAECYMVVTDEGFFLAPYINCKC